MMKLSFYLLIAFGGATGAVIRGWVGEQLSSQQGFPFSTFMVNMVGCLLMGILFQWHKEHNFEWLYPLLLVGFLGGLTTFSSFGLDIFKLLEAGNWNLLSIYILLSNILGLGLIYLGIKIAPFFVNQ